ncbi:dienelactone hydrolase family protein [uncultured Tateyamaria sp.]|uniref:dienelactone hydrolase family protein n=1 Tax=uncultured Tateyamaria sp. TaxID=455651 RepID=UPI002610BBBD|nr:dienelactone hydrolase family protein [uncultured Tateyamaria sp.]
MNGNWIDVTTNDGTMGAYLVTPPAGSGPGIVMLQEIFGVNAAMIAKAERFAEAGYTVLVPDVFWRMKPRVDLGYTEDERTQAFGYMQELDFAKAVDDIGTAFEALEAHDAATGAPSIIGYCLGGKLAVLAGHKSGRASAVVSFYGVKLDDNIDLLTSMPCPIALHIGDQDTHIPLDVAHRLEDALAPVLNADVYIYPGAQHGFFNAVRDSVYHQTSADLAWERTQSVLPSTEAVPA